MLSHRARGQGNAALGESRGHTALARRALFRNHSLIYRSSYDASLQEAGLKVKEYELIRKNFSVTGNFGKRSNELLTLRTAGSIIRRAYCQCMPNGL